MNIKGLYKAAAGAIGAFSLISTANAAVLEVVQVDITNAIGVESTTVLEDGVQYLLRISGVADIGVMADAEYWTLDGFATANDEHRGIDIGIALDGAGIDWGPFNIDHVYTALITGSGSLGRFSYLDTTYSDNSGFLLLSIETLANPVPVPGAMWLFGTALAAFSASRRGRAKKAKA